MVLDRGEIVVSVATLADHVFDSVEPVVEDEDYRFDAVSTHHGKFIEGELMRPVAGDQPCAARGFCHRDAEGGRGGPAD